MKTMLFVLGVVGMSAPSVLAYCTVSGAPGIIPLESQVIEMQDDAAWRAGRVVWVPMGVNNGTKVHTWLVWTHRPTGKNCVASFVEFRNDRCGGRVTVDFQQATSYNAGVAVADSATGSSSYPLSCTVELVFHVYDATPDPNPSYNPDDPRCPGPALVCQPTLVDPGFDHIAIVDMRVTGQRLIQDGGNPSTPPDVTQDGNCPVPEPGETLPAYMFRGPGCSGRANTPPARAAANAIRANSTTKLANSLAAVAARTRTQNGKPVLSSR